MPDIVTLANQRPSEVRLSPDGNRLYAADSDGFLRVYDMRTGYLIHSWDVGQNLGGMDISPDGSFLVIVERGLATTYKVDTATGAVAGYPYVPATFEGLLFDVAVLSDGTALFSQNFPGSGSVSLKVLDFGTGSYTPGETVNQSSVLSRSKTGEYVLIGEPNSSGGPMDVYRTGTGIVADTGAAGYNWGIQAFSGSLAAQYIYNEGIHIYNLDLELQTILTSWNFGKVSDLAFSADNAWLYILENESNSIIKVSTADWTVKETIPVAADVGAWSGMVGTTNGARLILDPGGRYYSIVTDTGLVVVDNVHAPPIDGTSGGGALEGALFGDKIVGYSGAEIFGFGGNDLLIAFSGQNKLYGGDGSDYLQAGTGNDILDGGAGPDFMQGGNGDDTYFVDDSADVVQERGAEGFDTVYARANYAFAAGQEIEVLAAANRSATTPLELVGNAYTNEIFGNAGANLLEGRGGFERMTGGKGDDLYVLDHKDDRVFENAGEGNDTIRSSVTITTTHSLNVERLILSGAAAIDATANDNASVLIGNEAVNQLDGRGGDDFIDGGAGADLMTGGTGNDFMDGGAGADAMTGGTGNDIFIVDHGSDYIFEAAGGGRDVIYSRTSYTLAAGVEIEVLSVISQGAGTVIDLTGNELTNELYGNTERNFLDGGAGADHLAGLAGNDTYVVDALGDIVAENAGEGRDVVYARADYVLTAGQEIEVLSALVQAAASPLQLTGNGFAQEIYGNAGANFIDGGGGADYLAGFGGNDTYIVAHPGDIIAESAGGGRDVVYARSGYTLNFGAEVEVLSAQSQGATTALDLTGNDLANEVYGNQGANLLNGGGGADYLMGFGGADTFQFTTALGDGNVDQIADFVSGIDRIALDDAIFGVFTANAFVAGTAAQDADDRIVYDSATGQLFFDSDGSGAGAAVLFATLVGHPTINASDFTLI
jgi:Ca2+-binding RTX toxin-like protein